LAERRKVYGDLAQSLSERPLLRLPFPFSFERLNDYFRYGNLALDGQCLGQLFRALTANLHRHTRS